VRPRQYLRKMEQQPLAEKAGAGAGYGSAPSQQTMDIKPVDSPVSSLWFPNPLSSALCCLCFPCVAPGICRQLNPNEHSAVIYFGEYSGTLSEPGLYFMNPCGLELWRITTKRQTLQLKDLKVLDARGNPVVISGVVTFAGTSAKKATIDVDHPWPGSMSSRRMGGGGDSFLELQAAAVLKRVASSFPYEAPHGEPSLQSEGASISRMLREQLQDKVEVMGAMVFAFDLVDLSYAPEIAQVMLVWQQAEALVDARRVIVTAAVDMTKDAVAKIKEGGGMLDDQACQQVTSNLLTVICSGTAATPTITMQ
jgi:hypothetical protein